jgi:hypothetical protein
VLSPDVGAVRHGSAAVADHTVLFFNQKHCFPFLYFVFFVNNKLHFINFAFNYSFFKSANKPVGRR